MAERMNIKTLLRRHGLHPKKSWSQNFLLDPGVLAAIVEAAGPFRDTPVVELGAGLGVLTALLAREADRVVAVERDRELAAVLRAEFGLDPRVEVLEANAATLDWVALTHRLGRPPVVVGNLPYHMATPILFSLLETEARLPRWVLMFQREMADRLAASPGSRIFGVLSVLVQMRSEVEPVLEVPPQAFHPAPKVHSRVVRFLPLHGTRFPVKSWPDFTRGVRAAFSQRRKILRNGLMGALRLDSATVDRVLAEAQIAPDVRAEELDLPAFVRLGDVLASVRDAQ
jgi:16S rRNA (adenine1518-N6/adenine1519-N6)-dimethyltransferase